MNSEEKNRDILQLVDNQYYFCLFIFIEILKILIIKGLEKTISSK